VRIWLPLALGVVGAVVAVAVLASGSALPSRQEIEQRLAGAVADAEDGAVVVTAACDGPADEHVSCRLHADDGRRGWAAVTLVRGSRGELSARERRDPHHFPHFPGHRATYRGGLVVDAAGVYDRELPAPFGTDARGVARALTLEAGLALRAVGLSGFVPFTCPALEVGASVTCTGRDLVPTATVDRVGEQVLRLRFVVPVP
jgi:hypothetical protein